MEMLEPPTRRETLLIGVRRRGGYSDWPDVWLVDEYER